MAKALTGQVVERLRADPARRLEVPDGLLPGLYLIVQPSGVRSWAVRYRYAGKPRKLTLGPYPALDLATARNTAREALRAVALGRDPGAEKRNAASTADADLVRSVVQTFVERHVRPNTRRRTAEETERTFRKHVLPVWGDRRIQDIDRREVIALLDRIVDQGTPIAANRTLAAVRKLFNWCLDRSIVQASPCVRITPPSAERSRKRVLRDAELRLVWLAAERIGYPFGTMVQMLILTGQRRDEVSGMRRNEIQDGVWRIPAERTKNGVEHQVALTDPAQRVLASAPCIAGSDLVFTTTGKTPISGYSNAKERLDTLVLRIAQEQAGEDVTIEPWRLHDLRRTAASGMARLGVAVNVIEAVLNHRSGQLSGVTAVYNRYSYAVEKRRALELWSKFVVATSKEDHATCL